MKSIEKSTCHWLEYFFDLGLKNHPKSINLFKTVNNKNYIKMSFPDQCYDGHGCCPMSNETIHHHYFSIPKKNAEWNPKLPVLGFKVEKDEILSIFFPHRLIATQRFDYDREEDGSIEYGMVFPCLEEEKEYKFEETEKYFMFRSEGIIHENKLCCYPYDQDHFIVGIQKKF